MVGQSAYSDGVTHETDSEKVARLERENEQLRREIERLRRALDEALRAAKRNDTLVSVRAAPFSRRHPKAHPEKPGRIAGPNYGRAYRREVPKVVDEVVEVPVLAHCPRCGGGVEETGVVSQYQMEIPHSDRMVQAEAKTGQVTEFPLSSRGYQIRNFDIEMTANPPAVWFMNQRDGSIVRFQEYTE